MSSNGGIPKDMKELIEFLVASKVKKFKQGDTEIEFDSEPAQLELPLVEYKNELPHKPGKDGLTQEEQISLYGRVIDAT